MMVLKFQIQFKETYMKAEIKKLHKQTSQNDT